MNYHAPTKQFSVKADDLEHAVYHLRYALAKIRMLAGLPLDPYERPSGEYTQACFAQVAILESCNALGIDLGVTLQRFNELDLREFG